jgi:hypothetical protein
MNRGGAPRAAAPLLTVAARVTTALALVALVGWHAGEWWARSSAHRSNPLEHASVASVALALLAWVSIGVGLVGSHARAEKVVLGVLVSFVMLGAWATVLPQFHGKRERLNRLACFTNQLTLASALEASDAARRVKTHAIDVATVERLRSEGRLSAPLLDPGQGSNPPMSFAFDADGRVTCTVHGNRWK